MPSAVLRRFSKAAAKIYRMERQLRHEDRPRLPAEYYFATTKTKIKRREQRQQIEDGKTQWLAEEKDFFHPRK